MSSRDLDSNSLVAALAAEVVRIQPRIRPDQIQPDASLTQDLAMDSHDLASLFTFIKSNVVDVDLTPWFLSAARRGGDSLGSLAEFLAQARHRAA
jgi:hypothetical protein